MTSLQIPAKISTVGWALAHQKTKSLDPVVKPRDDKLEELYSTLSFVLLMKIRGPKGIPLKNLL